jgi:LacI family transcriptional regulator
LIQNGFKRIAHITSSPYLSITRERLDGYKAALEKYEIPYNESLVKYCNHGGMMLDEVEVAVNELYSLKSKPDALFTAGDRLTTVCLGIIKRSKEKIGEPPITGFTNTNLAELFCPSLTTVRQPAFDIGQVATELLIQIIESKRPVTAFETRVLETELIIRESSKG